MKLRPMSMVMLGATAVGQHRTGNAGEPDRRRGRSTVAAATPYCGITWGSLVKSQSATAVSSLVGVRAGRQTVQRPHGARHPGQGHGYRVEYVPEVYHDASGELVPLRGGAKLLIVAYAPAYDENTTTYQPADPSKGWWTSPASPRSVRSPGPARSEGQSNIGLGVRARLPFRVFTLDGPGTGSRLVIDVAHQW